MKDGVVGAVRGNDANTDLIAKQPEKAAAMPGIRLQTIAKGSLCKIVWTEAALCTTFPDIGPQNQVCSRCYPNNDAKPSVKFCVRTACCQFRIRSKVDNSSEKTRCRSLELKTTRLGTPASNCPFSSLRFLPSKQHAATRAHENVRELCRRTASGSSGDICRCSAQAVAAGRSDLLHLSNLREAGNRTICPPSKT